MNRRARWILAAAGLVLLAGGLRLWQMRVRPADQAALEEEKLFTGKEAKRKVRLLYAAADKPGFTEESAEIHATASKVAQAKQALRQLFKGPAGTAAAPAFPQGWRYRELFLTESGMAVVDLDPAGVAALPGGTSSEYIVLYTMLKALTDNFKDIRSVQFLVGGEIKESLAGHMDISRPLSPTDF